MNCGQHRSHPIVWWRGCKRALIAVVLTCSFILFFEGSARADFSTQFVNQSPQMTYTAKQYAVAFMSVEPRRLAQVRGLPRPGAEKPRHRQILFWRTHPKQYQAWRLTHMSPREAAGIIWRREFGWSRAQVQMGYYIIRNENASWNPCRGNGKPQGISCRSALNAGHHVNGRAYGIPQALPGWKMRSAGADWATNPLTQIRWFAKYVKSHHGSIERAYAYKRANGTY